LLNKLISGTDHIEQNNKPAFLPSRRNMKDKQVLTGSSLYQIPVPENLQPKTYGALMKLLAKDGILAIGLLRGMLYNMNIGPKSNKMPYVYTNPSKSTEVYTCDRVFVLSQRVLTANTDSKSKIPSALSIKVNNNIYVYMLFEV
jgi:hypothetical protein